MSEVYWLLELEVIPGQLDNMKSLVNEMVAATQANEPGTLSYEYSLNADKSICHIYERYTDSSAALTHLGTFGSQFAERFMTVFKPVAFTVYGSPSEELKGALAAFGPAYMELAEGFSR